MKKKWRQMICLGVAVLLAVSCTMCAGAPAEQEDTGGSPMADSGESAGDTVETEPLAEPSETDPQAATAGVDFSERLELEIMGFYDSDVAGDEVIQYLSEKFNVDIKTTIVNTDGYAQAVQMRIAGGDYPDWIRNSDDLLYIQLLEDGQLVNISDYVDEFDLSNIRAMTEIKNAGLLAEDEGFYRLPNYNGHLASGYYVRKDWLEELDLKVPETMDELREMLEAMVAADPDGNGTIGITCDWVGSVEQMMIGFTGFNTWKLEGDEVTYSRTTEGFKEGLHYFNQLFENNLLDPELAINSYEKAIEKMATGRAAVLFRNMNQSWWSTVETALDAYDPEAELYALIPFPEGPQGDILMGNPGFGYTYIPAAVSEEKRVRLLHMIDYLLSDEGKALTLYGVDDQYMTEVDGQSAQDGEAAKNAWGSNIHFLGEMANYGTVDLLTTTPQILEFHDYQDQVGEVDPAAFMLSDVSVEYSTRITEVFRKWLVDFLTGEKDIDENWELYLQEMEEAGLPEYAEMVKEYLKAR